jgi:rhodanese-related sulfurtransferase
VHATRTGCARICRLVYDRHVSIREVDVGDLAELLRGDQPVSLIDVRELNEYEAAHVPGAILIPLGDIAARADELPAGPIHVICGSGMRSMKACEALAPMGHDVTNVEGGTGGWIQSGYSTITGGSPE